MSYAKIRPRRGTAYEWSTVNPILDEGELGIEFPDSGIGTGLCKFKLGDGSTKWNDLPYAFDAASANSITGGTVESFHLIQLRSGSSDQWSTVNPVLNLNEIAYDSTANSFKVGDGSTKWNDLSYITSADSLESVMDFGIEEEYV